MENHSQTQETTIVIILHLPENRIKQLYQTTIIKMLNHLSLKIINHAR